ncbi:hypothetical protein L1887_11407 [Cichorium endivia]|nr:hypothetical protein L1887_11407 [Cichorium endivia]
MKGISNAAFPSFQGNKRKIGENLEQEEDYTGGRRSRLDGEFTGAVEKDNTAHFPHHPSTEGGHQKKHYEKKEIKRLLSSSLSISVQFPTFDRSHLRFRLNLCEFSATIRYPIRFPM